MNKKVLYISSTLPSITLTFVYREINALVEYGYDIYTVSMGKPSILNVSKEALHIYNNTIYLDQVSWIQKVMSQFRVMLLRPKKWWIYLFEAVSEREISTTKDYLRLIYHFMDAGYLFLRLRKCKIKHIHAHFLTGPTTIAYFLAGYLNIKYSFTMHASNIFIDPIMLKKKLVNCSEAVTISQYNKNYILKKYGHKFTRKIHVIHCGIDLSEFIPDNKEKSNPPIILSVGQLVKRKGIKYLIEACDILCKMNFQFQCIIVGDGEEYEILKNEIEKLKIENFVRLIGRKTQNKVKELLKQASIFVLPSIVTKEGGREGIPVALMEAMAMKIPVISTKTVGIPELITDGKEGLLVQQKDGRELASAIEFMIKNTIEAKKMGVNGRKKIKDSFNIANTAELMKKIFGH